MSDEYDPPDKGHYFRVEMTTSQRLLILDAIRKFSTASTALKKSAEQVVQLAEQMPGSIKDKLAFDKLEEELERRGGAWTVADLAEEGF